MSHTISRGLCTASRWLGVASAAGEYVQQLINCTHASAKKPKRAISALIEFMEGVLAGEGPSRGEPNPQNIPIMAGISNLIIAIEVIARMNGGIEPSAEKAQEIVRAHLKTLLQVGGSGVVYKKSADELLEFIRQLMARGQDEET
jgi:hypothetical protein